MAERKVKGKNIRHSLNNGSKAPKAEKTNDTAKKADGIDFTKELTPVMGWSIFGGSLAVAVGVALAVILPML